MSEVDVSKDFSSLTKDWDEYNDAYASLFDLEKPTVGSQFILIPHLTETLAMYLMNTLFSGHGGVYLFPNSPFLMNEGNMIICYLMMLFCFLFVSSFLNLKKRSPLLHKIGLVVMANVLLGIFHVLFFSSRLSHEHYFKIGMPLFYLYPLAASFYLVRLKYRPSYFFLFGTQLFVPMHESKFW